MKEPTGRSPGAGEAGFTLVETLVAVVVLIFGLMAVTNLMLVAASSNSVANQGTAAVTSAERAMEMLKSTSYQNFPVAGGGTNFATTDVPIKTCTDPTLAVIDWHCNDEVPGVGIIHTHWWIAATADPRLMYVRVRSEGTGVLAAGRSRAEFTSFRACTNSDVGTGGCPVAP